MTEPRDEIAELIERLREQITSDHVHGCMGRQYSCDCGYDLVTEGTLEQAATQLAALSARVKEQQAFMKELTDALRAVRPLGGSELFVKRWGDYYADPVYCKAAIEERTEAYHEAMKDSVRNRKRAEEAEARATRLQQERDELEAQLPDGMKHCTITFHECEKGHGRLSATNWIDSGCPWCQRDEAYERAAKVCDDAANAWDHLTPAQRSTKLKHRTEGMAHGARCIVSAIRRLASGSEKEKEKKE